MSSHIEMDEVENLIVGAGISGLSLASFLGGDFRIYEKDTSPGGYCKTSYKDGFVWDYSGHFFHFTNEEIKDFVFENVEGKVLSIKKDTKIFYKGKLIEFPFQKNIHQLEKEEFIDCIHDFYFAQENENKSFSDFVYGKFGKSIAEKFLIPYNEKLYSCDLDTLDKDCMGRFFPDASFEETVRNFRLPDNNSYNDTFIYPEKGAMQFVESVLKRLDNDKILLGRNIDSIDIDNKVMTTSDGKKTKYKKLISTIPLEKLLDLIGQGNRIRLQSNKVLVINMGFESPIKNPSHWMYFPEKEYNFYRIGIYSNILQQKRGSIYVEIGFRREEVIDVEAQIKTTIENLKKIGLVKEDPISYETIVMSPAYCHITKENEEKIKELFEELEKNDVYSIGRYGRWTYCSIEDNIIEAKRLAKKINNDI